MEIEENILDEIIDKSFNKKMNFYTCYDPIFNKIEVYDKFNKNFTFSENKYFSNKIILRTKYDILEINFNRNYTIFNE